MYSLWLVCEPEEVDLLSAELWDAGTTGIREIDDDGRVTLVASFETNEHQSEILTEFSAYAPQWIADDAIDWEAVSSDAWPGREIGSRFFVVPHWHVAPKTSGRLRLTHNPGLACGTGEHPCTQLALIAFEKFVSPGCVVVDVGTGSGILAIAALRLGAALAMGIDVDCASLAAARENFDLNELTADLVCGSAECLADGCSDVTVANISGTVLLAIWEELVRITRRPGYLIVTGFPEAELGAFQQLLPQPEVFEMKEWRCVAARLV
jgi:ribosomal protein L11 methyltransferase